MTCLAIFTAALWLPYIVVVNTFPKGTLPDDAPDGFTISANWKLHRPWVQRAYRVHMKLLEKLAPFAILVFMVDRVEGFTAPTFCTAIAFFWLRVAHAVRYITAWPKYPLGSIIFKSGWVC